MAQASSHPTHQTLSDHTKGLRAIAIFEGAKGLLVLLAGTGLLTIIHEGADTAGENIIRHLHMNPAHHYPQIFLKLMNHTTNQTLVLLALGALLYSVVRFSEAYGLWNNRAWAEWFAIISGGIYLPFEFFELYRSVSGVKIIITALNLLMILYLFLYRERVAHSSAERKMS
jgi:uncharacterized membrane protein (DUF2068 family)